MAGPIFAKRPQGNRTRPKSVAIAVPLKYEKKSQTAVTMEKDLISVTAIKVSDTSSPATTSETFYTPGTTSTKTTNGGSSSPEASRTLKSEHSGISMLSQEDPKHQQDKADAGVTSSWAGNAQSTCIVEADQDFDDVYGRTQLTESKKPYRRMDDSDKHRTLSFKSVAGISQNHITAQLSQGKKIQHLKDAQATISIPDGVVTQGSKESEHKEYSNNNRQHVSDMVQLQNMNGNTECRALESMTRAQMDGTKVTNVKVFDMAVATIRGLQEMAEAKRASAADTQADSIHSSQNVSSQANDDVSKIAKNVGEMVIEVGGRRSVGIRQESPTKRPDTDLRHRIHLHHPSQGSINFMSYHNSSHSSPAPHASHSGQSYGPYPPATQLMHSNINSFPTFPPGLGFSPLPTPQMMHSPRLNNFSRQHHPQSFGLSPSGTPGMEEQHHFHLSRAGQGFHAQTSPLQAQQPFHSALPHSPSRGPMHGGNVLVEDSPHCSQGSESHTVSASYTGSPLQPGDVGDELDGLLSYIQLQFNNATTADHHFQVNFAPKDGKQVLPLVLVGHSLLFSRSALLRQLMATDSSIIVDSGAPRRLITLTLNDRFARPDSVWIALQRLYGGSLLNVDTLPDTFHSRPSNLGATLETEKFDLALGYVIIGQILQMPPVEERGIEVACHFLHWSVLLKALDFAEGHIDYELAHMNHGGAGIQRKYGRASDTLLHETLTYIIMNFPADFKLNTTFVDSEQLRRLPTSSIPHFKKHHPKLSGMKFGDFRFDDDATGEEQGPETATGSHTILSVILLNLPFPLLKYVLESPSLGHNSEVIGNEPRLCLTSEVVRERERRRIQIANGVVLTTRGGETQQEEALWWRESVGHRGLMPQLLREKLQAPFGHALPA